MTLDEIYRDIFPLGAVDNNNRYIEMGSSELNTIQLLEPTISVSELNIGKNRNSDNLPDRMSFRLPLININDQMVRNELVNYFCLDMSSFVPTLTFEFVDVQNELLSTNSIKDGSIIKIYIGGNGDELYYKPIRLDFVVTNVIKINQGNQNLGEWLQYRLSGTLNVPMGYRKDSWSNSPSTSMQELFNLSIYTGLGFATNFTYNTIDKMKWENTVGGTYLDFMKNISDHACYSPNTFFTSFIDQYYVLNFVECHSLLSHGGNKKDTPAMIYNNIQQFQEPSVDKSKNIFNGFTNINEETSDQLNLNGEDAFSNSSQKVSYYFISNYHYFDGWSNFIESYNEISEGYSSMDDGYRKHLTYSDSNSGGWGSNYEFIITPINNLKRNDLTQEIESLPSDVNKNSYIPLNLIQTNNSEYQKSQPSVDNLAEVESFVNLGEVDTSNMFKQYYFAEVQNEFQMRCMKKCGLNVTLQNYNPAITKFSRIWVDLYDMNMSSTLDLKPKKLDINNEEDKTLYDKYVEQLNENIIYYKEEGLFETSGTTENYPRGNYNRSLSGWYVVTEMKLTFDNFTKNLKTHLVLNRIEHRPLYKNEYNLAKNAIDKYKQENKPECIFVNIDDYSYSE